jgi:iron(III) transport system substrate-binding protein
MGADELYELAKKETGSISVYSETSTIGKVADAFMQDFPGLTVETYTLTPAEIQEKVKTEQETGNVTADVIIVNDAAGSIYNEWYPDDYVQAYYPTDVVSHIAPEKLSSEMPLYEALNIWFYNTAQFPDGSPINNWWDIIETDENGSQKYHIYCKNISGDTQYMSFYANMLNHADELEQAYFDKYGKELEYTYDSNAVAVPENNAVYEFLYRFAQLEVGFISDGDEIMKAVAESTEPTLGFATANKLDQRDENNWPLAWVTQMKPFASQSAPKNLYLVSNSDNPAGSRLLMYYLMGGKNADTAALDMFSRLGCWFFRDDYTDTANEIGLDEISIVQIDKTKVYDTYLTLNDFWVYWNDYFA